MWLEQWVVCKNFEGMISMLQVIVLGVYESSDGWGSISMWLGTKKIELISLINFLNKQKIVHFSSSYII